MRVEYLFLFFGMAIVTFIPRVLPFYMHKAVKLPKYIESPLKILPFAALGAFIIPNGLTVYSESVLIAPISLFIASITTWFTNSIPLGIFLSILAVIILL